MKILYRIMDIFCHPSRIVFYYKDKIYVLIIHFLAFALMAVGVTAGMAFSGYYVSRADGEAFSKAIFESKQAAEVEYNDYKLSGNRQLFLQAHLEFILIWNSLLSILVLNLLLY